MSGDSEKGITSEDMMGKKDGGSSKSGEKEVLNDTVEQKTKDGESVSQEKEKHVDEKNCEETEKENHRNLAETKQTVTNTAISKTNNGATTEKKAEEENTTSLGKIAKINETISKTRVDALQILYSICFDSPGKMNVVKKNLRNFSGFEFDVNSEQYMKKIEFIEKQDIKSLKNVCDILNIDKKGSKEEISEKIMKFLISPEGEPEKDEDDEEEEELEVEPVIEEEEKPKRKRVSAQIDKISKSGRPRRATAGKSNRDLSTYVDYSTSEESDRKAPVAKRRKRKGDSDSGSDYNPSGGSDSEGGRNKKAIRHSGRGRPPRRSRRKNSESEESVSSDDESDEPKRKRALPTGNKQRGRPPLTARSRKSKKKSESEDLEEEEDEVEEEEDEEDDEESERNSVKSDDESKKKKITSLKNNRTSNRAKTITQAKTKSQKNIKGKKEISSDDKEINKNKEDEESEDEPLSKKTKPAPPTDDEIKGYVKEILDEANLEEITMKTVCKQVYAKYPEFDLTDKKDFIKATVKSLIAA